MRISLPLATTMMVFLKGKMQINCARVFHQVIQSQIKNPIAQIEARNLKFFYLVPYITHLYWSVTCLSDIEQRKLSPLYPVAIAFTLELEEAINVPPEHDKLDYFLNTKRDLKLLNTSVTF